MKAKYYWILLFAVLLTGCNDNTGNLGLGILPPSDILETKMKPYPFSTASIPADSVFSKTNVGYIGRYTDQLFGRYDASFLTQLYCIDSISFPEVYDPNKVYPEGKEQIVMRSNKIRMIELELDYDKGGYFGDSLSVCRMSVYKLNKALNKNHYTNLDPTEFYDEGDLLTTKVYTAYDASIPDSVREDMVYHYIKMPLDNKLGQDMYDRYIDDPKTFAKNFVSDIFPGVYIKTDYGDGVILYVDGVSLNLEFDLLKIDSLGQVVKYYETGEDSVFNGAVHFAATKEVIQAHRFDNSKELEEKINETQHTYVKSPAGIFTQITLPIQQIADELKNDTLNSISLSFDSYVDNNTDDLYAMPIPTCMMLIRQNEMETFFESNKIRDNVTSYIYPEVGYAMSGTKYTYSNIANLISYCVAEKKKAKEEAEEKGIAWDEDKWVEETNWDKMVLVPVVVNTDGNTSSPQIINIQHDLSPRYVKLKGGKNSEEQLTMEVRYTSFAE